MDGLFFFALSTAGDISDFKGHGLKDPGDKGAKLKKKQKKRPKMSSHPRSYFSLDQNLINTYNLIYMDDHIPFLCPKKNGIQRSEKKKRPRSKKVVTPRPSLSRPVHLKYPPEPLKLVATTSFKMEVVSPHYPIPCTPDLH